jgi:hypothetical protein
MEGVPVGEPPPTSEKREVPKISTATLAEIHFNQGHIQEAIDIYKERLIATLESWLNKIRESSKMLASA